MVVVVVYYHIIIILLSSTVVVVVTVVVVIIIIIIIIIINLIYTAQFDTNGILTALYIVIVVIFLLSLRVCNGEGDVLQGLQRTSACRYCVPGVTELCSQEHSKC